MSASKTYCVYFMSDPSHAVLYIGATGDLERRVSEHKAHALEGFTKTYDATELVYCESFSNADEAIAREKQLKKWTRAKKNALVYRTNPTWEDLGKR